jgi:hypothetical protein
METKLERISQLSSQNPDMVFTSIGHYVNKELLWKCHEKMDGDKAVGIDGITLIFPRTIIAIMRIKGLLYQHSVASKIFKIQDFVTRISM